MTTKRKQILKAIALAGTATMDDLVMATGLVRKNLHDNVKVTMNEDLIERIRDDVTGQPAYKLTAKGRKWLENDKDDKPANPAVAPQERKQESVTQAGSGDVTPAVVHRVSVVDGGSERTDTSPEGAAETEPPKLDKTPAKARSGENKVDLMMTGIEAHRLLLSIAAESGYSAGDFGDLAAHIAEIISTSDLWRASSDRQQARADEAERGLESILSANRKFCGYVAELVEGAQYPVNLYECQQIIDDLLASALETIAEKDARIASLEENRILQLETTSTAVVKDSLTAQPPTAGDLLHRAAGHMAARAATYDAPDGERSMGKTVLAFNILTGHELSEADGWLLMQILKDARQWQQNGYHADSAEDCIAYAALKAESLARIAA